MAQAYSIDAVTAAAQQAMARGQWSDAERWLRELTTRAPSLPQAWADLGYCLRLQHKLADAERILLAAIEFHPTDPAIHQVLGTVYLDAQRGPDAITTFSRAITLRPDSAAAHYGMALALQREGRLRDAVGPAQTAADLESTQIQYQLLAAALMQWDVRPDAVDHARRFADRAMSLRPRTAVQWQLLAKTLWRLDDRERALAANRQAVHVSPQSASAHWHLATALLSVGQFEAGWAEFEWRLAAMPHLRRSFPQPKWEGQSLAGKTILLHAEGGLGDAVQFVRFLPWAASQADAVLLECQPALVQLFARSFPATRVFSRGDVLPPFDFHLPLQGLPRVFGWTPVAAPVATPYLTVDPAAVAAWSKQLASMRGFKVGIVWAGSFRVSEEADDRSRSVRFFKALADVPAVTLICLQKGDDAWQAQEAVFPLVDWTSAIETFDDLAALVSSLDLCVSVDTGVAHLAGALGKRVWTLIPAAADFRWMLDRTDSPWYPTMRLYRQATGEAWERVFARVAADLELFKNAERG